MTVPQKDNRVRLVAAAIGLAIALLVAAWLLGYFEPDGGFSSNPQVADLQRAMQASGSEDKELLWKQYKALTPEQQKEFGTWKMLMSLPKQEQKLRDFFAQPQEAQWAQIDREIDTIQSKRQHAGATSTTKGNERTAIATSPKGILSMKQAWTANASPELRSMMDRRVRMVNQRREQRGLGPL